MSRVDKWDRKYIKRRLEKAANDAVDPRMNELGRLEVKQTFMDLFENYTGPTELTIGKEVLNPSLYPHLLAVDGNFYAAQGVNSEEPLLGYFDDEDEPAREEEIEVDCELEEKRQKYLDKVQTSGLSLLDQPNYPEFTKPEEEFKPFSHFPRSLRPPELAHIDDEVWDRYGEQIVESKGFDIVDFPGVTSDTPVVPMNLDTNQEAIARAKDVADLAIKSYNYKNNTGFVVVSVDKANCNPELCCFVDSEKYVVVYAPYRECFCKEGAKICFCRFLMFDDMFFITFTAKDEKKDDVTKIFQAQVVHERESNKDVVTYCREKVVGSI